jgi:hypothetical protein
MFPAIRRIITDGVLPVIAIRSLAPIRAMNDMRAGRATGETLASFSPTSC